MNVINQDTRQGQWFAALILALGLAAAAAIWGRAFVAARMAGEGLSVKGYAEAGAVSELAVWNCSVSARATDLARAAVDLEEQARRAATWLEANGVPPAEWEWLPLQTETLYQRASERDYSNTTVAGYLLTRPLRVTSKRVTEIAALSLKTESLLREGVSWNSQAPEFYLGNLEELKLDLLGKAAADARRRAEVLVGGPRRLGGLRDARQGIIQVTPPNTVDVADYGMYSTETIRKTVKAVVTVTFALRP